MSFYRRKLPHWQPEGGEYFVTIRLKGSLPRSAINKLKKIQRQLNNGDDEINEGLEVLIQRKIFKKYEEYLDKGLTGPTWLSRNEIANLVKESIHYRDSKIYDLYAYCIMPNHVHLIFKHLRNDKKKEKPITDVMRSLKRYTARKCNKLLGRSGAFWQSESYDRVIRNLDELKNTIRYTLNNPVKAGLVESWQHWPHSYCKPEFTETFK